MIKVLDETKDYVIFKAPLYVKKFFNNFKNEEKVTEKERKQLLGIIKKSKKEGTTLFEEVKKRYGI